jgi:hypothetical protein
MAIRDEQNHVEFELGEIAKILRMSITKVKNWTIGCPFKLEPSIGTITGHGSRNLYSLEDMYLMGVANTEQGGDGRERHREAGGRR